MTSSRMYPCFSLEVNLYSHRCLVNDLVHHSSFVCQRATFLETSILSSIIVWITIFQMTSNILVIQCRSELRSFSNIAITEKSFQVTSVGVSVVGRSDQRIV